MCFCQLLFSFIIVLCGTVSYLNSEYDFHFLPGDGKKTIYF